MAAQIGCRSEGKSRLDRLNDRSAWKQDLFPALLFHFQA